MACASRWTAAPRGGEVAGDGGNPLLVRPAFRGAAHGADFRRQRPREVGDLVRPQRQAVVGLGGGAGDTRPDGVEAVHRRLRRVAVLVDAPARHEVVDVAQVARPAAEEVGVQGHDHVRLREGVDGVSVLAEGQLGGLPRCVVAQRLVLVPARLGERLEQLLNLLVQRRRDDGFRQQAQAGATALALVGHRPPQRRHAVDGDGAEGGVPRRRLAAGADRLRAVRVVEGQDRRLMKHIGRAEAAGVLGVALDLRRPALVTLDQQTDAYAAERHGGGVEQRPAGDDLLGLADVGDDVDGRRRLDRAAAQPGQAQRGGHQGQEAAPAQRVGPGRRPLRELALDHLAEGVGVGQLLQRPPVLLARGAPQGVELRGQVLARVHRWHTEQLVRKRASRTS